MDTAEAILCGDLPDDVVLLIFAHPQLDVGVLARLGLACKGADNFVRRRVSAVSIDLFRHRIKGIGFKKWILEVLTADNRLCRVSYFGFRGDWTDFQRVFEWVHQGGTLDMLTVSLERISLAFNLSTRSPLELTREQCKSGAQEVISQFDGILSKLVTRQCEWVRVSFSSYLLPVEYIEIESIVNVLKRIMVVGSPGFILPSHGFRGIDRLLYDRALWESGAVARLFPRNENTWNEACYFTDSVKLPEALALARHLIETYWRVGATEKWAVFADKQNWTLLSRGGSMPLVPLREWTNDLGKLELVLEL